MGYMGEPLSTFIIIIIIIIITGWGPQDSVQLPYKWLYGRYNYSYWEL